MFLAAIEWILGLRGDDGLLAHPRRLKVRLSLLDGLTVLVAAQCAVLLLLLRLLRGDR